MAILAGLVGPFVVQSRQSYASDMFAHVALGGIGLALVAGAGPWWGALPALLVVATLLWYLENTRTYQSDALAILFLSGGLALALACVHIARDQVFSFENYLFGSILTLGSSEVFVMVTMTILVCGLLYVLWYPLLGATHHPVYTIPFSNRPQVLRLVFFWILAVVVWVGIKTVGGLLVGALLVIPTLVVRSWVESFRALCVWSTTVTVSAVVIGLGAALFVDIPPSSLIVGVLIVLFIIQLVVLRFVRVRQNT